MISAWLVQLRCERKGRGEAGEGRIRIRSLIVIGGSAQWQSLLASGGRRVCVLIVAGYFRIAAGDRAAFLENRRASVVRSRGERGCHAYALSADLVDPELVHLYERWESKEDLAAHAAANQANPRPPDGFKVLESEVLQYEIARVGALGS